MADATTASLATALLGLNRKRDPLDIYNSFAKQQLATGTSTAPLGSGNPLEGIARALQGGLGGLVQGYAAGKEEQRGKDTVTTLGDLYNAPDDATRAKIIQNTKGDIDIIGPIAAQLLGNKQTQQAAGATLGPLGVPVAAAGTAPAAGPMPQGGGAGPPGGIPQPGYSGATAPGGFSQQTLGTLESGNNPQAVNPQSGAAGTYQFMPETWADVRKGNPQLNLPESVAQASPEQQAIAEQAFRAQNAKTLQAAGIPPTPGNLYLAHRTGAQGAQTILQASPDTPLSTIVPPSWVQQNPDMRTTAGQFVAQANQRFPSGGQAAPGQNVGPIASPPPAQGSGPTPTPQPGPPTARSSPAGDQLRQTAQAFAQAGNNAEAEKYGKAAVEADAKWSALVGEKNVDQSYEDVKHQRSVADEQARHQRDLQDKKDNPTYTQEQNLAHTYATRLNNAIPQLEALVKDPSKIPSWNEQLQANSPYYPEPLVSDKAKEFRRVTKDIMSSTLRRESGASIHNDEYATEAQKFIPQPGDPPEVVANKLAALKQAGRSIAEGTGRPVTTYGVFGAQPPAGSGAGGPAQGGGGIPDPPPGFRPIR